MRKQKHRKKGTVQRAARSRPSVLSDKPAVDGSHDTIDRELLGIWLSISRLRHLIRMRTSGNRAIALRRAALKKTTPRKPRRKAA
jgi:hypothetical protein